jgi:hypothetical protein
VSALAPHALAARFLADAFATGASELVAIEGRGGAINQTTFHTLCAMEDCYRLAADRMEQHIREQLAANPGGCTFAGSIKGRCPACHQMHNAG